MIQQGPPSGMLLQKAGYNARIRNMAVLVMRRYSSAKGKKPQPILPKNHLKVEKGVRGG